MGDDGEAWTTGGDTDMNDDQMARRILCCDGAKAPSGWICMCDEDGTPWWVPPSITIEDRIAEIERKMALLWAVHTGEGY